MEFNQYQFASKGFLLCSANKSPYLFTGLAGEVGEVCSLYAKAIRDNRGAVCAKELQKELGDVLWFVAQIAQYYGITLDDVATGNIEKLQSRKDRNKIGGSGNDR